MAATNLIDDIFNPPKPNPQTPTPTPGPAPDPTSDSSRIAFTPATPGSMVDFTMLGDTPIYRSDDFTPENPGSFEIQNSADYRGHLDDTYKGFTAETASTLAVLAEQRGFERNETVKACGALRELSSHDTAILIEKLNTRDHVADEQLKRAEAVGGSLKKHFKRGERYTELKYGVHAALGESMLNMRKTAASYGAEFMKTVGQ